jgi:hypothetical protein
LRIESSKVVGTENLSSYRDMANRYAPGEDRRGDRD